MPSGGWAGMWGRSALRILGQMRCGFWGSALRVLAAIERALKVERGVAATCDKEKSQG